MTSFIIPRKQSTSHMTGCVMSVLSNHSNLEGIVQSALEISFESGWQQKLISCIIYSHFRRESGETRTYRGCVLKDLQKALLSKMNAASNQNTTFLFTSESVGEGHPGKFGVSNYQLSNAYSFFNFYMERLQFSYMVHY